MTTKSLAVVTAKPVSPIRGSNWVECNTEDAWADILNFALLDKYKSCVQKYYLHRDKPRWWWATPSHNKEFFMLPRLNLYLGKSSPRYRINFVLKEGQEYLCIWKDISR